ncbi:MAG: hypothetical protein IKL23_07550, partial [Oscillospiraceae bacterium]|nr:hypothetical protein [Oscillospiraceae bacterium]
MKKNFKTLLARVLAVTMLISLLPMSVLANSYYVVGSNGQIDKDLEYSDYYDAAGYYAIEVYYNFDSDATNYYDTFLYYHTERPAVLKYDLPDGGTKAGHTFDGWMQGVNKVDAEGGVSVPVDANEVQLNASWLSKSNDASIKTVTVNGKEAKAVTDVDGYDYYVALDAYAKTVEIEVATNHSAAKVTEGEISNPAAGALTKYTVTVTAEDGTTKDYVIAVWN